MKFNYEYAIKRKGIKEEDILGREIISYVTNISEDILIWQNTMKFYSPETGIYRYLDNRPFYIRKFEEKASIFVWDLDILNYVLQEAKLAEVTEAKVITWKENKLDFEKDYEWFYMDKRLIIHLVNPTRLPNIYCKIFSFRNPHNIPRFLLYPLL